MNNGCTRQILMLIAVKSFLCTAAFSQQQEQGVINLGIFADKVNQASNQLSQACSEADQACREVAAVLRNKKNIKDAKGMDLLVETASQKLQVAIGNLKQYLNCVEAILKNVPENESNSESIKSFQALKNREALYELQLIEVQECKAANMVSLIHQQILAAVDERQIMKLQLQIAKLRDVQLQIIDKIKTAREQALPQYQKQWSQKLKQKESDLAATEQLGIDAQNLARDSSLSEHLNILN